MKVFGSVCYVHVPMRVGDADKNGNRQRKRQKLDIRSIRGSFVGYAESKHSYKVLDCTTGKMLVSVHVTFDESNSPAAKGLRRDNLKQLARIHELDFNYYSKQAESGPDRLFHADVVQDLLDDRDLTVLQDFVAEFDSEVSDTARDEVVEEYAPDVASANSIALSNATFVRTSQLQRYLERLVAEENAVASQTAAFWQYQRRPFPFHSTTWMFRAKERADGTIERFKARLVVRGYMQVMGVDYSEVFAPVVRLETLRSLLAIANALGLKAHQKDIDTAFLNKVVIAWGRRAKLGLPNDNLSDLSLELIKSLYGLKQAPREWHKVLVKFLNSIGFEKSLSESSIYVRKVKDQMAIVAIYVDDLVLLAKNDDTMEALKAQVKARFACKDMCPIHFILGLRIQRDEATMTIKIDQRLNALNMLCRFGLNKCHPADTPMKTPLSSADCPPDGAPGDDLHSKYRQGVGCLMYLMIGTRPDIAYVVQAT
ncbi:hypothetical protein Ae201684P_020425 [Aphanomyces euteiches]|uniref:Uncharacterized protein n=1 Tax=Aphanomyces euteiches TaxID=100861 RepID=A0A6G0WFS6_9STRA|nr:hypothetical protein Ae201684_015487 [Aphanomyces euteiches]KAH9084171.1 hypothetical protein Ae201684P_020425 [Aphanomyces euteiches]